MSDFSKTQTTGLPGVQQLIDDSPVSPSKRSDNFTDNATLESIMTDSNINHNHL